MWQRCARGSWDEKHLRIDSSNDGSSELNICAWWHKCKWGQMTFEQLINVILNFQCSNWRENKTIFERFFLVVVVVVCHLRHRFRLLEKWYALWKKSDNIYARFQWTVLSYSLCFVSTIQTVCLWCCEYIFRLEFTVTVLTFVFRVSEMPTIALTLLQFCKYGCAYQTHTTNLLLDITYKM